MCPAVKHWHTFCRNSKHGSYVTRALLRKRILPSYLHTQWTSFVDLFWLTKYKVPLSWPKQMWVLPTFRDRSCVYAENRFRRLANGNTTSLSDDAMGSIKGGEILHQLSDDQLFLRKWRSGSALHLYSRGSRFEPRLKFYAGFLSH